jgi:hypothetical protein
VEKSRAGRERLRMWLQVVFKGTWEVHDVCKGLVDAALAEIRGRQRQF